MLTSLHDKGAGYGHDTNKISIIDRENKIRKLTGYTLIVKQLIWLKVKQPATSILNSVQIYCEVFLSIPSAVVSFSVQMLFIGDQISGNSARDSFFLLLQNYHL